MNWVYFQGFHILSDTCDGFGGLSASVLEYLQDEYSSKGRFMFGVTPNDVEDDVRVYLFSTE